MAVRTSVIAVKGVLLRGYNTRDNPPLLPFIEMASVVVDTLRTRAAAAGLGITRANLELIERNLAAHFYAMSDPGYRSRSTEGASASFDGQTGKMLDYTPHGQRAMMLDPSGLLRGIVSGRMASMGWLGKTVPEQLSYEDRN
jgi:hypothetical protein